MPNQKESPVIWWRFGKEHGEDDFRVNSSMTVTDHLDQKIARLRQTPPEQWQWWRDSDVIVEKPTPSIHYREDTRIYYLIERGLTVIEAIHLPPPREQWYWYIHLADIFYDEQRQCWINKDLFCDIVLDPTGERYHLMDLADLGDALAIRLITSEETTSILHRSDAIVSTIVSGVFPFPEIEHARQMCQLLGW